MDRHVPRIECGVLAETGDDVGLMRNPIKLRDIIVQQPVLIFRR